MNRFQDLIGFFHKIAAEALVGLLSIPGAAVRSSQPGYGGDKIIEAIGHKRIDSTWLDMCLSVSTAVKRGSALAAAELFIERG